MLLQLICLLSYDTDIRVCSSKTDSIFLFPKLWVSLYNHIQLLYIVKLRQPSQVREHFVRQPSSVRPHEHILPLLNARSTGALC